MTRNIDDIVANFYGDLNSHHLSAIEQSRRRTLQSISAVALSGRSKSRHSPTRRVLAIAVVAFVTGGVAFGGEHIQGLFTADTPASDRTQALADVSPDAATLTDPDQEAARGRVKALLERNWDLAPTDMTEQFGGRVNEPKVLLEERVRDGTVTLYGAATGHGACFALAYGPAFDGSSCVRAFNLEAPIAWSISESARGTSFFGLAADEVQGLVLTLSDGSRESVRVRNNGFVWRDPQGSLRPTSVRVQFDGGSTSDLAIPSPKR